jgi:hypothetical protein
MSEIIFDTEWHKDLPDKEGHYWLKGDPWSYKAVLRRSIYPEEQ